MVKIADKDTVTKEYMQDSATFADAFNYFLYGGRQVIKPDQLRPLDTTSIALPYGDDEKPHPQQRQRDVIKTVIAMEDDRAAYILGIENQSDVHYAMPVRNMLYDAMDYASQVSAIARSHRGGKDRPETRGEYLSGFHKTDKLLPIITLTICFSPESWDAPLDLYGMLDADEEILQFVDNYHLHLIVPADISDDRFGLFHTELSQALKFIKYSNDKEKLSEVVEADTAYRSISRRTADMVNIVTNSNMSYTEGKERVDMCEAIEGIRNDGIQIGTIRTLIKLVKDGVISINIAASEAGMTVEEFEQKMAAYNA